MNRLVFIVIVLNGQYLSCALLVKKKKITQNIGINNEKKKANKSHQYQNQKIWYHPSLVGTECSA